MLLSDVLMSDAEFNSQVASGGKVPIKPGGCNCSDIPEALEYPTGLPNSQLSEKQKKKKGG